MEGETWECNERWRESWRGEAWKCIVDGARRGIALVLLVDEARWNPILVLVVVDRVRRGVVLALLVLAAVIDGVMRDSALVLLDVVDEARRAVVVVEGARQIVVDAMQRVVLVDFFTPR